MEKFQADVWKLEPFRISFLLRSVYDTLPSPANLCRWNLREDPACKLCGERGTMAHILSGCKVALAQGRYRWRHDKVLAVIAELLEQQRRKKRQDRPRPDLAMTFVREGEVKPAAGRRDNSILQRAKSWELRVDLGRRMHFPQVVQTNLRPDAVLSSEDGKKIVMIVWPVCIGLVPLMHSSRKKCENDHLYCSTTYRAIPPESPERGGG
ncbi:hypothetical protein Bbelb_171300 [Branchiostoma belcheri]|nr:hypothetical protein Bbelb_171300 [Branchiostoma belcheri]